MYFNKLYTFQRVAAAGSVTLASQQLSRSQSAITQQIQSLEDELGLKLFERKSRTIFLTTEGKEIYDLASNYLEKINHGVSQVKGNLTSLEGTIQIGLLQDHSTVFDIEELVIKFSKQYPKASFQFTIGTSHQIEQGLRDNQIDVGCLINFKQKSFFNRTPLSKSKHILVTSKKYLKQSGPFKSAKDILDSYLIDFDQDFLCLKPWFYKNFPNQARYLGHRTPNITAPNHLMVKALILSGTGIAILPEPLIKRELKKDILVQLMPQKKSLEVTMDLAVKKVRSPNHLLNEFTSFIQQQI